MTEQAKQARRKYKNEWNRKNRDRVKRYQENYWSRKAKAAAEKDEPKQEE